MRGYESIVEGGGFWIMKTKEGTHKLITNLPILLVIALFCFLNAGLANADSHTYILSGGTSSATPLVVDADLEVMVNGKTIFIDDDKVNTSDERAWWKGTPIPFFASPGDTLRIIATNSGGMDVELSELYLHVKGKSLKLTDGVTRRSSEIYTFFDQNFTIPIHNGSISISSAPSGAQVFFDGVYKGTTLLSLEDVICKSYTIMIVKGGFYRETKEISLGAGETIKLHIPLRRYAGSISVSSSPSGASVYLNGIYKGMTPITLTDVPVGDYSIKLTKSGYDNITKTVSVSTGETTDVSETLKEKTTPTLSSVVTPTPKSMVTPTPPSMVTPTPSPIPRGGIEGNIFDAETGFSIEGATVTLIKLLKTERSTVGVPIYTDSYGYFKFRDLDMGFYEIKVEHENYETLIEKVSLYPTAPEVGYTLELQPISPLLPITPEYLYVIPITLFLILLPLIFYTRGKKKKPATTTPEKPSPPSPEQKESERQKVASSQKSM